MDNLFTLIIIIIAILSLFGKVKPKERSPKTSKSKGRPSWLDKLNAFIEEAQKSQSSQAPEEDSDIGASQWRALMESETAGIPRHSSRETDLSDLELDDVPEPTKARPASNAARARAGLPKREPVVADPPAVSVEHQDSRLTLPNGRADLRRAIVWSEILGPPVALKDPHRR